MSAASNLAQSDADKFKKMYEPTLLYLILFLLAAIHMDLNTNTHLSFWVYVICLSLCNPVRIHKSLLFRNFGLKYLNFRATGASFFQGYGLTGNTVKLNASL